MFRSDRVIRRELEGLFNETEAKKKCLVSTASLGLIYDYKTGCVKVEDSAYWVPNMICSKKY